MLRGAMQPTEKEDCEGDSTMGIGKKTLSDGKTVWVVCEYTGFTLSGKRDRKTVTCRTEKEAKLEQAKIVAMRDAMRNRSGRMNFAAYVDGWFWPSKRDLAPSTKDGYRRELKLRLLPAFGNMDVRDIDRMRIQRMVDACPTEKVARNAVAVLKTVLNMAKGDGLILSNPACAGFCWPEKGTRTPNPTVITTFSAMASLFQAIDDYGDAEVEKMAVTGLLMGLRPEERYGLDWKDIDFAAHAVHVHQAYTSASKESGGSAVRQTKTEKSTRWVPMPPNAERRLARLRRHGNIVSTGPFLPGKWTPRTNPSSARRRWERFLSWCDGEGRHFPHITLENMRHSFATSYLHAGGNVEDLNRILGHSDINTTYRRYVRPNMEDLRAGMQAVTAG